MYLFGYTGLAPAKHPQNFSNKMPGSDKPETWGSEPRYWTKPRDNFPKASAILYSGFLYCQDCVSTAPAPYIFVMTSTRLLQVLWWTKDKVEFLEGNVNWVTVEAFEESDGKCSRLGFTLKRGEWGSNFYVTDKEDLDKWLDKLSQVAIMTTLRDDYKMQGEIGRGGQSIVYMGRDRTTGEKVAIKSYDKQRLIKSAKYMRCFINEVELLRTILHPNLLKLRRVYESPSSIDLVTDYYEGQVLSNSLSRPFNQSESIRFMVNLMDILQYLECEGIVHRDIKPANIVLTNPKDRAEFKLIDFGLAKRCKGTELCDTSGSPGYFAPEILLKRSHGIKADIYAAGIVFYTLITGTNPFISSSCSKMLRLNRENEIFFNSVVWQSISPTVVSIIRVMTNLNPERRMDAKDLHTWLLRTSGSKYVPRKLGISQFHSADEVENLETNRCKWQCARNRRSSAGDIQQ